MAKSNLKGINEHVKNEKIEEMEKPSFGKRLTAIRDRFKLGPHHKMERFTVMVSAALVVVLSFSALSFGSYRAEVASLASEQSVLSTEFAFSLSEQEGDIQGVYGDKNRTDVMVLFKLDNPTTMSTNAENYELFITGEADSLDYTPDVSFALFGTTGYGMVRFEHAAGIPNEIMDVTLRSNKDLTGVEEKDATDLEDGSFAKYDQARFFVNPGAEKINELEHVKPGEDDPAVLYTALVAETQDDAVREEIKTVTKEMGSLLTRADEYENRLVSSGFKAPDAPWFVDGDYVSEDGVLVPAINLPGAHLIDYANTSVYDGYTTQVTDSAKTYTTYVEKMKLDRAAAAETKPETFQTIEQIEEMDGGMLDLTTVVTGTSPSAQVAAKDSVESLSNAWRSYVTLKSELQRDLMMKLLVLDADIQSQPSTYSEHTGDTVATIY